MKNNKGLTLITVVVMIIIIIIIATTSLLNASKLMTNSKAMVGEQEIESVRNAINARQTEINMQGTFTPAGDQLYVGKYSPMIANDAIQAKGWYLLNEESLKELGVTNLRTMFLVNYQRGIVLPLEDENHVEKYLIYAFIDKVSSKKLNHTIGAYIGERLSNSTSSTDGKMYVDTKDMSSKDVYGNGWFKVDKEQIVEELNGDYGVIDITELVKHNYLINYEDNKFVFFTSTMVLK